MQLLFRLGKFKNKNRVWLHVSILDIKMKNVKQRESRLVELVKLTAIHLRRQKTTSVYSIGVVVGDN